MLIDIIFEEYDDTFSFSKTNSRTLVISVKNEYCKDDVIYRRTQGDQWILLFEGNPAAIIRKSEVKGNEKLPSSDKNDWDRVLGVVDEVIFREQLQTCYKNLPS